MTRIRIALAAGALILAGLGTASAQAVIVQGGYGVPYGYGPPAYVIAPAPFYAVPVGPPAVYVAPAPTYVAPVAPIHRWHRDVVVAPGWDTGPGVMYSDW